MARVIYLQEAIEDLQQIWGYLAKQTQSSDIADRVIESIVNAADLYAMNSALGTARDELVAGLRCFTVARYVVFFLPCETGIEVVQVIHGSRDIPTRFRRKRK
jgi:toxin ParE1/3/4